eukprot:6197295-Pleurochrysis_carterae.AAC.3
MALVSTAFVSVTRVGAAMLTCSHRTCECSQCGWELLQSALSSLSFAFVESVSNGELHLPGRNAMRFHIILASFASAVPSHLHEHHNSQLNLPFIGQADFSRSTPQHWRQPAGVDTLLCISIVDQLCDVDSCFPSHKADPTARAAAGGHAS